MHSVWFSNVFTTENENNIHCRSAYDMRFSNRFSPGPSFGWVLLNTTYKETVIDYSGDQLRDLVNLSELNVHYVCWPGVWYQIRAISHHLLVPVQDKHQYS